MALLCSGALCLAMLSANAAATNSPTQKPTTPAHTNTAAKAPIEVPVSKFAIPTTLAEGRNPFFPESTRVISQAATTNSPGRTPTFELVLKGISVVGTKRFALINNRTFEENEDADVTVGRSKIHVLCLKIKEDSVVVDIDGTRQELRLRPGL